MYRDITIPLISNEYSAVTHYKGTSLYHDYFFLSWTMQEKTREKTVSYMTQTSKIEKVPRAFQDEKSRKDTACSGKLVSTIEESPKLRTEPGVRKGKRSLLACLTHYKCSVETTRNSAKVNIGNKVIKLVESMIGLGVTVTDQRSECH